MYGLTLSFPSSVLLVSMSYCKTKYHGLVSLKIEDDTSSAKANKQAQVSVISQAQPQINVSSRKTEIPQADKAELASEPSSRHQV